MTRHAMPFVFALLAACSGAVDGEGAANAEARFTDTIVTIDADGQIQQTVITVSADARRAELDALDKGELDELDVNVSAATGAGGEAVATNRQALLQTNAACAASDLWVYDEKQANRICISGTHLVGHKQGDYLDFAAIRYGSQCLQRVLNGPCINTWYGKVAWVWAGSRRGYIYSDSDPSPTASFDPWSQIKPVVPAVSRFLWLWG